MRVKLLRIMRQDAMKTLTKYTVNCGESAWRVSSISYAPTSTWQHALMHFTVTNGQSFAYQGEPVKKDFFETMFRIKVCSLRWHNSDGYCNFIRHRYRKYTRRWKSAHGKKLGIRAENGWL